MFDLNLNQFQKIDLSEANDLITPLAAAMAIGGGGIIVGASHAQFKESNRITRTVEMLSQFSIDVEPTPDGLKINGGQRLIPPQSTVLTFGDHRMQMTAIILASKVGAEIKGDNMGVTSAVIKSKKDSSEQDISFDGVFIAIGHKPNTDIFADQLDMDEGYIIVKNDSGYATQSNVPGVFAAGDVTDKIYRQAITSAGSGCMAALDAEKFIDSLE